jgi:hypothetical protein
MLSLPLSIGGVFWLVYLAADSLKTTQRPAIVATVLPMSSPAGFATLKATVTASGMSTDERCLVQVDLINDPEVPPDRQKMEATMVIGGHRTWWASVDLNWVRCISPDVAVTI